MAIDQAHRQNVSSLFLPVIESVNPCLILVVRRENIVGDAMEVLRKTKNIDYKKPLKVIWHFLLYNWDFYSEAMFKIVLFVFSESLKLNK